MKLIGSLASPFVRKVRVVMAEKKIDYQLELVDVWDPDSPIRHANPLGKVPCLVMEDGGAMFDSRVIVEYLDNLTPVHRLIPADFRARAEVKCWEALCDGMVDAASLVRLELTRRADHERSPALMQRQMDKVDAALAAMASGLGDKPFACEGRYSLADVCIVCAMDWLAFRFPQLAWRELHTNLARHVERMASRPSFIDTSPR